MSESGKHIDFKISDKKLFGKLVEFISDFIVIVSAEGKTKYVSPSFYNSLGYTEEETLNHFIFSFIHPDDLTKTKEDYKNLFAYPDIAQKVEIRLLHKNGSIRFITGNRKNLLSDPDVEGIILAGRDITDLVIIKNSILENNQKLELQTRLLNVTELISRVGGWEYDVRNKQMFWTEETYRIHEIDPKDLPPGSTEHVNKSLECYLPEYRDEIKKAFDNCISNGEAYDLEFPFITCSGKSLWIRTVAKPIIENQKVVKLVGNIADITQRKKTELIAEARVRLIQFSYHSKLDEFLQKVLDEVELITHSKIGFYHFVESDQITLSLQAWSTNTIQNMCKAEGKGLHYNIDKAGVWVDCVHQRKTIVHNDYESLTHKKGLPEGHAPVIREVVVPVFRDDKIVSILGVGNKENYYDENDVEIIAEIADLAWDITERKRAEQLLTASEAKYRLLFDASPIGIGIADFEGKIITSNAVMKELTGYDFENENNLNVMSLYVNENDRKVLLDNISKYGRIRDWEVELRRKDGSVYNALINVDIIELDENKYLLTNLRDVTESKRHRAVLEESERLKKTVLDSLYANVAVLDSAGNIITVNKPWEKFALNNGVNNLIGTVERVNYFDVLCNSLENGDSNVESILNGIKSVVNGKQPFFETEYPCDSPSEKRWFVMHAAPLENGIGAVVTHENITQRKIAEEQLKESEEKLKQLYILQRNQNEELISKNAELKKARLSTLNIIEDLSREIKEHKRAQELIKQSEQRFKTVADHTYDWEYWINAENKIEYMSPSCKRITGYEREEFFEDPKLLERILHPDDMLNFILHHSEDVDYDNKNNVHDIEYRIISKEGVQINIQHLCRPIFDDSKKYLGRRVSNRDITQKKLIEIELRNSEAKYQELYNLLRLMSDTMPDMLWAKDLDKKYLFANKALCESLLFANDTNEPIGKTDMYFVERQRRLHPENPEWHTFGELCQDSDAVTLSEMKHMQFDEFGNVKGKFLFLDVNKAPLINDKGELIGTVGSARDITISKEAEKALKESESKNRAFLNAIPDIIFILSQDGIFLDYKSESDHQLLMPPEQFIGKHIRDVLPEKLATLTIEKIGKLFTSGQTQIYDYQIEQNGKIRSFENRLVLSGDNQILSIIRDITSSKEAEEKIKRLTHAIEQSKVSIIITDVSGKIEYFNPMFSNITGYTYDELKGKDVNIINSGSANEMVLDEMWQMIKTGKDWSGEFLNKKKNGDLFWVSSNISPIFNNEGEIINFIAIQEDITDQKKITQELIDAKNKAEEMNKVKSYFFANMSHELRTPFVGILGFSEMLTECLPDPEYKGYAEQILKSARRLTDTLNKILNITRLEFDRYELNPEDVDINEMVVETSGLYSQSCKNNNSYIKTDLLFDKNLIRIDRRLIEEILNNLISNAVKYTQDGVIEISNKRVEIEGKNVLEIVISDTGLGIPKEMQDIIWQEFRQASEGYSRSFEGTGLGLTITKKYVELLEGKIYLDSEVGKGSTFTIHIPIEIVDSEVNQTDKMDTNIQHTKKQEIKLDKPKILYVEDDIISLDYITLVLKSAYEIDTAFKVKTALELVYKNKYDLLLLDINLGRGIDGVELMQQIRQIDFYKNIPIVAVTAYAAEADKLEFLAKGFTHYISKPFSSQELKDLLTKIFS